MSEGDACPVCGGDCAGANPPVTFCPNKNSLAMDKDRHLHRAVTCKCGWAGGSGQLIARDKLRCPECDNDQIDYVIAPSSEQQH